MRDEWMGYIGRRVKLKRKMRNMSASFPRGTIMQIDFITPYSNKSRGVLILRQPATGLEIWYFRKDHCELVP